MKTKFKIFTLIAAFSLSLPLGAVLSENSSFALFANDNSTWVHYNKALPGTIEGSEYGSREYWVQCGGNYQFSKPSTSNIQEATSYDFSEFEANDPRYIIPIVEEKGEYKSVLRDLSGVTSLHFNEVSQLTSDYTCDTNDLPSIAGTSKKVVYYSSTSFDTKPWYFVNTNAYTKVFYDWNNFRHYFAGTASSGSTITKYSSGVYQDGIFALSSNFAITQNIQYSGVSFTSECLDRGFRGTFDGRGHTISETYSSYSGGIFGGVLGGTIKNLTLDTVKLANEDRGALCSQSHNGNFSNITINISSISNTSTNGTGILAGKYLSGNTFNNVTINANGLTIPNVFGGYYAKDTNSFTRVRVIASSVTSWCGNNYSGNNYSKPVGVLFNDEPEEIIVPGDPQDIVASSSLTQAISLGEDYQSISNVISITLKVNDHEYSLGTNVKNLVIPQALIDTPTDSGEATVIVKETNSRLFNVKVVVVTKYLKTLADIEALAAYSTNTAPIKGYYVINEDLTLGSFTKETAASWNFANGFEGTLDGRNHSLSLDIASCKNGLFGVIKNATIKNISITSLTYTGSEAMLAYYMDSTVIDNVNLMINSTITSTTGNAEFVINNGGHLSNKYTNFTFTCATPIDSLYRHYYNNDTFTNCSFILPSLRLFANGTNVVKDPPTGVSIIRTISEGKSIILDRSKGTYTLDVTIPGTVQDVYWNDTKISSSLTIDTSVFGKTFGEAGNLIVHYLSNNIPCSVIFPLTIASKVISTVNDVKTFLDIADLENGVSSDGIYTGYFVFANDITWDGTTYQKQMTEIPYETKGDKQYGKGFIGTIDGKGHCIDSLYISCSGGPHEMSAFVTRLGAGGVIKNLGFSNLSFTNSAVVAAWGEGTCENIYVSFKKNIVRYATFAITNPYAYRHNSVLLKDSIVDARNDESERPIVLGQSFSEYSLLYNNVLVLTPNMDKTLIKYNGDSESGTTSPCGKCQPLSYDTYSVYLNYPDLLKDNKDEINNWESFTYLNNTLKFGDKVLSTELPSSISTHNFIDDYVIVYDKDNFESIKASYLIEKELYKATGTISYVESGSRTNVYVDGGTIINKVAYSTYDSDKNLIVVGNDDVIKEAGITTTKNRIAKVGNSIVISASDHNDLLACGYEFLTKVVGYKPLGQDYILYNEVPTSVPQIDEEFTVSVKERLTTNLMSSYFYEKMGINVAHSGNLFSIGPTDHPSETIHNTLDWLPYETYGTPHPSWYRSDGKLDICFTAHGDANEYQAMVDELALRMYESLQNNPTADRLCFGMEDINYTHCNCSACKNAETAYGSYSGQGIKLLNDVTNKINTKTGMLDRDYVVYLLAYYFTTKAPSGVSLNDNVGVLYAPIRYDAGTSSSSPIIPEQASSIYASSNSFAKQQLEAWFNLVKNKNSNKDSLGFWFYDTMFKNYFGFMDTYESILTWIECAYHTTGGNFKFLFVQGQTTQYPNTSFETFKQYVNSRAFIEIADKIQAYSSYSSDDNYLTAISNYLHVLENDFFGISTRSNNARFIPSSDLDYKNISSYAAYCTFQDGGYYGSASTNSSMYRMYLCMRSEYYYLTTTASTKLGKYVGAEYVLQTSSQANFSYGNKNTSLYSYVNQSGTMKTYYRFSQMRRDRIASYLAHYAEAMTNIEKYTGSDKDIAKRHIQIEGLGPIFLACMFNSTNSSYGYGSGITFGGVTYSLVELRTLFKTMCNNYGMNKVNEGGDISKIYSLWGI